MNKLSAFKIVQLTVTILITIACFLCLFSADVKQLILANAGATALFIAVWIVLLADYIFLLLDFRFISKTKLDFNSLYETAYADPLSGMPNRFSCDVLIDKYYDKELPEHIGCIMMELTNLPEINAQHGHSAGNEALKKFSSVLNAASLGKCFVGRNGGNKFLAIFEECDRQMLDEFLTRVDSGLPVTIEYKAGCALNAAAHVSGITQLISLANKRIYEPAADSPAESLPGGK